MKTSAKHNLLRILLATLVLVAPPQACTSRVPPKSDLTTKDRPAKEKPVQKSEQWVTGGGETKVVTPKHRRPLAEAKSWETSGDARPPVPAFGASGARAKSATPMALGSAGAPMSRAADAAGYSPAPSKKHKPGFHDHAHGDVFETGRQNVSPEANLLTAGSFDDALDLPQFEKFWRGSPLGLRSIDGLPKSGWSAFARKPPSARGKALQLAFVVDTTGSMGDELEYLKSEFKTIVKDVEKAMPEVEKEYAVIVYKDDGDEYVTRGISFSREEAEIQRFIDQQSAGGGGDYPEAMHTAFAEARDRLQWDGSSSTAKLIFHIADAPPHDQDIGAAIRHIKSLGELGVGVYPIASSGVADVAEAVMRASALMTGGQYIFLTDDSGIGNSHQAPKHPCYHVEKLKDVMSRMVLDRVSGSRSQPLASKVIRTVGDPQTATCRATKLTSTRTR